MAARKAERDLRDLVHDTMVLLQRTSMSGQVAIPMPQRLAMKGHASALFEQWIELEAARFNLAGADYLLAAAAVRGGLADLHREIAEIDSAIAVVDKATATISAIDGLLKVAVKHLPIGG